MAAKSPERTTLIPEPVCPPIGDPNGVGSRSRRAAGPARQSRARRRARGAVSGREDHDRGERCCHEPGVGVIGAQRQLPAALGRPVRLADGRPPGDGRVSLAHLPTHGVGARHGGRLCSVHLAVRAVRRVRRSDHRPLQQTRRDDRRRRGARGPCAPRAVRGHALVAGRVRAQLRDRERRRLLRPVQARDPSRPRQQGRAAARQLPPRHRRESHRDRGIRPGGLPPGLRVDGNGLPHRLADLRGLGHRDHAHALPRAGTRGDGAHGELFLAGAPRGPELSPSPPCPAG